jgi:hypothetical protein
LRQTTTTSFPIVSTSSNAIILSHHSTPNNYRWYSADKWYTIHSARAFFHSSGMRSISTEDGDSKLLRNVGICLQVHTALQFRTSIGFSKCYRPDKIAKLPFIYLYNRQVLVGDYLPLRDFEPYGIIFMNVCDIITVAMVILLRDFGPYGIIFMTCIFIMTMYVYHFRFSRRSWWAIY